METKEYHTNFLLEDSYWWFSGRRKIVGEILKTWIQKKSFARILDAGCGTGKMVEFLNGFGACAGLELHSEGIEFCKQRKLERIVQGNIARLPFREHSITLVSCFDVLYHKEVDESLALAEVSRVCAPNGFIVITDAAFEFLRSEHDASVHGVRRYTKRTLSAAVERAGFQVIRISYWNFFLFPVVALIRLIKNRLPKKGGRPVSDLQQLPKIVNTALYWIVCIEAYLMRFMSLPFGTSIVLIAKKTS